MKMHAGKSCRTCRRSSVSKFVSPSRATRVCVHTQRLERSTLSRQSKEKGHPFRLLGVVSAMENFFNETAMQARTLASNRQEKAIKASRGPRVTPQSKAEVKTTMEKFQGKSKGTEGAMQVSQRLRLR